MFKPGRRRFVLTATGLGASLALANWRLGELTGAQDASKLKKFSRTSHALGTKVSIVVLHSEQQQADRALDAAFSAIEVVEAELSIYLPESQLSQLNRLGRMKHPSPGLLAVLECAEETSRRSQGAFDITVQPLWEQFASAQQQGRLPSAEETARAKLCVGWQRVRTSAEEVILQGQGTKLTLNGIAQGYAADRARAALVQHGIEHALIDTGELSALGAKPQASGWRVGVQHPREPQAYIALANLKNRCLSTSGDYATTFSRDRRVHHVFDPATGTSPSELASVSIAAPTAMQADAWSTAAFVLGSRRASEILSSLPDHDALFVLKDGRTLATPGFPLEDELPLDVQGAQL